MKRWMLFILCVIGISVMAQNRKTYSNPIIGGFNPDPSVCRVGDDYYLVTSSFEYFPGVPVYHSKDLVNWTMIGHVLDRPSQLNLDKAPCSGGIYAPTIRYNKGTFYLITTLVGGSGNFIVTAKNPAGPWSEPHWLKDAPGIDPSLLFDDDGKVYYCGNISPKEKVFEKHRNIWVQELDIVNWKLVGPRVQIVDGSEFYKSNSRMDGGIESGVNNYEAPHIYKKGGFYYLIHANGGTSENHAVSIWKSENIFGPYKPCPWNPILTHRDLSHNFVFTSTGHADIFQTQNGEWYVVYLAKRPLGESYIMGRETFMSPVDWSGEWPVVNPNGYVGKGEITHPVPNLPQDKVTTNNVFRDDFDATTLRPEWTFIRTPRSEWWSLNKNKSNLRISLRPCKISEIVNPSFIGIRQQHYNFVISTKMSFKPMNANEEAGLVIERDNNSYFKFVISSQSKDKGLISLVSNQIGVGEKVLFKTALTKAVKYLRISCNGYLYTYSYSSDNKKWINLAKDIDGRLLGTREAGRFTGTFIGMYASSNGQKSDNYVDFDWFEYKH